MPPPPPPNPLTFQMGAPLENGTKVDTRHKTHVVNIHRNKPDSRGCCLVTTTKWGGGTSSGDMWTISAGENFDTPPVLVQGHQTRETSTPPTLWSLVDNQFCETLASEMDSLSVADAQGAGRAPNCAKKFRGENFDTN